nr:IS1 family transposase [Algoriphagus sp. Y33]
MAQTKAISTGRLKNYKYLIPKKIHLTNVNGINHIERMNLNLRTHLKRLNRRTICFSRSVAMLAACLKIYFWG